MKVRVHNEADLGMTLLRALPASDLPMMEAAAALSFHKLSYTIDMLDGDIDPPLEMIGSGMTIDYMNAFMPRIAEDPLRRMIARGEVEVKNAPVVFENDGSEIRVGARRIAGPRGGLLAWCLTQGIRTGVSFRIRLDSGQCASVNFYSAQAFTRETLHDVLPTIFLTGHLVHAHLEAKRTRPSETLLSRRETECLAWMARGASNCEIARVLGISTETVKEHVHNLYRKFRVKGRAQAVARGYALALLD